MRLDISRFRAAPALFLAVLICLVTVPVVAVNTPSEPISDADQAALKTAVEAAEGHFTPITETEIREAKNGLKKAVEKLNHEFQNIDSKRAQGWKKYLDWDQFTKTLAGDKPDMEQLKKTDKALSASHRGLELACFVDVRLALEKYMNLRLASESPKIKAAYDKLMIGFPKLLTEYTDKPTSDPGTPLAQVVAWLDKFEQAPSLLAKLRARFAKPNFYASASQRLIAPGMEDKVDEPVDIDDVILKTQVHSTGTMLGQTTLALVPCDTAAVLEVKLTGTTETNNVGRRGPVWIHSDSTSQIEAIKKITIDAEGIHTEPAEAQVDTLTEFRSIRTRHGCRLIENFAWKQACKSKRRAEAIASCRTEQRVCDQVNEKAAPTVDKANGSYRNQFMFPLVHRKLFPSELKFSTTSDRLNIVALQHGLAQFAAWSDPPEIDEASTDAAVRIHESVINNSTWTFLAGRTFAEEEFLALITDLSGGKLPDRFKPDDDQEPWAITFAKENPIRVTFDDGKIRIEIRATSFKKGNNKYTAMNIAATYKIESKDGQFELTRVGDLEIFPPDVEKAKRQLSAREHVLRKLLEKRFSKIFESKWETRPSVPLPERWKSAGPLRLIGWSAADGWMMMTWKLEE